MKKTLVLTLILWGLTSYSVFANDIIGVLENGHITGVARASFQAVATASPETSTSSKTFNDTEKKLVTTLYGASGTALYNQMTEAVKTVQTSTKTQIDNLNSKLETIKAADNAKAADAWKDCLSKLDTAVKNGDWANISKIFTDYHTAIEGSTSAKNAINAEIAALKTKEATAIKEVRTYFIGEIKKLTQVYSNQINHGFTNLYIEKGVGVGAISTIASTSALTP